LVVVLGPKKACTRPPAKYAGAAVVRLAAFSGSFLGSSQFHQSGIVAC